MADLSVQTIDRSGLNPTLSAAAGGGDKFVNDGATFVYVANGSVAPITVSFAIQPTIDGISVTAKQVSVPAAGFRLIGPFPTNFYNDATSKVNITYSGVTTLTIGALKLATG